MMEGVVTQIRPNGMAEVVIREDPGGCIPGAPEVNHCHCHGCSAVISVEALNRVGAAVGDRVQVGHRPGAVLRSVGTLLGIPIAGLLSGSVFAGVLYRGTVVDGFLALIVGAVLFAAGLVAGILLYRREGLENHPVITGVIHGGIQGSVPFPCA